MGRRRLVVRTDGSSSFSISNYLPVTIGVLTTAWLLRQQPGIDANQLTKQVERRFAWTIFGALVLSAMILWNIYWTMIRGRFAGFAVSIDPSAVHLEYALEPVFQTVKYQSRQVVPRGEIVDCVVTEIILVHKVENAVILRRQKTKPAIDVFPWTNLTYSECLHIRDEINYALKRQR